ncbi:MAG: hypothetical protein ACK5YI_23590 [Rhodospirillales bacterium]|jgi:hypothetical protein
MTTRLVLFEAPTLTRAAPVMRGVEVVREGIERVTETVTDEHGKRWTYTFNRRVDPQRDRDEDR